MGHFNFDFEAAEGLAIESYDARFAPVNTTQAGDAKIYRLNAARIYMARNTGGSDLYYELAEDLGTNQFVVDWKYENAFTSNTSGIMLNLDSTNGNFYLVLCDQGRAEIRRYASWANAETLASLTGQSWAAQDTFKIERDSVAGTIKVFRNGGATPVVQTAAATAHTNQRIGVFLYSTGGIDNLSTADLVVTPTASVGPVGTLTQFARDVSIPIANFGGAITSITVNGLDHTSLITAQNATSVTLKYLRKAVDASGPVTVQASDGTDTASETSVQFDVTHPYEVPYQAVDSNSIFNGVTLKESAFAPACWRIVSSPAEITLDTSDPLLFANDVNDWMTPQAGYVGTVQLVIEIVDPETDLTPRNLTRTIDLVVGQEVVTVAAHSEQSGYVSNGANQITPPLTTVAANSEQQALVVVGSNQILPPVHTTGSHSRQASASTGGVSGLIQPVHTAGVSSLQEPVSTEGHNMDAIVQDFVSTRLYPSRKRVDLRLAG